MQLVRVGRLMSKRVILGPEAQSLIGAMTNTPSPARQALISQTIVQLKTFGVWDKMDILYMTAAHDAQAARLNWKNPNTFALTAVNSPTFTADQGYAGNGTTSYLSSGWIPGTNGVQFALNSSHLGIWCRTNAAENTVITGAGNDSISPRNTAGNVAGIRLQNSTAKTSSIGDTNTGHKLALRDESTTVDFYSNGVAIDVALASNSSSGLSTEEIFIGGRNVTGTLTAPSARQVSAVHYGSLLTGTEIANTYTALNTYLVGVGAV